MSCICLAGRPICSFRGKTGRKPSVRNEILALIDREDVGALRKYLERWLPKNLAPVIADLSIGEFASLFRAGSSEPKPERKRLRVVSNIAEDVSRLLAPLL